MMAGKTCGSALGAYVLFSLLAAAPLAAQAETGTNLLAAQSGGPPSGAIERPAQAPEPLSAALRPHAPGGTLAPAMEDLQELVRLHAPAALQPRARGSIPLMAAGGTLLVAGAIIGGDAGTLVMVAGAGLLAWGVYLHF